MLVIIGYFTKCVEFVPLRKVSAKAVADAFFDNFVSKFDAPMKLISDNCSCFVSDIFKALCVKLKIFHAFTVPCWYHSNMDG